MAKRTNSNDQFDAKYVLSYDNGNNNDDNDKDNDNNNNDNNRKP